MESKKTVYDSVDELLETGINDPSIHIANGAEYSTLIADHRLMKEALEKIKKETYRGCSPLVAFGISDEALKNITL